MTQTNASEPEGLHLSEDIVARIDGSLAAHLPILVAYVDGEGQAHLSFRGSTHVWSEDQLAIWVRSAEGGLPQAIAKNPRLTIMYRDPETRTTFYFYGRGRVESGDEIRKAVYEGSPEPEQRSDPERKGVPVIVDLDLVEGGSAAGRISMRRA